MSPMEDHAPLTLKPLQEVKIALLKANGKQSPNRAATSAHTITRIAHQAGAMQNATQSDNISIGIHALMLLYIF